jgi:protein-disulfide isomerase
VEGALAHGKIALLLFWNPHGTDDVAVRGQVRALPKRLRVAVYEASPKEVASFGSITRQVPVYGTPTMIIIGKHGRTTTLTGLQDTFTIEQAIAEARSTSP